MIVCRRMNSHSSLVERAGLVEDRVRDRHLADVVQLGGARGPAPNFVAAIPSSRGVASAKRANIAKVVAQRGVALAQGAAAARRGLCAGRGAPPAFWRVHALVGQPQSVGGWAPRWHATAP